MLMILPTSQLLEIGSMKLPSAIKLSSKPKKFHLSTKKIFRVNFRDIKKCVCELLGYSFFCPSKLRCFFAPKKCLKKRLNFYIFFL